MSYIGLPWADVGRDVDTGLDCYGLLRLIWSRELGIDLPSLDGRYEHSRDLDTVGALASDPEAVLPVVEVQRPQRWDMLIYRCPRVSAHIGVYIDRGRFVHQPYGKPSRVERMSSAYWRSKLDGVYRAIGSREEKSIPA
jgi:cell wall-associated NlpC family hydrolase